MEAKSQEEFVYRLIAAGEWAHAQAAGFVAPSEHDERDGFMHLSTREQVLETAKRYFCGRTDLLALEIKASALTDLRFELSRNREAFPHLYGELPFKAVVRALPVRLIDGAFVLTGAAP